MRISGGSSRAVALWVAALALLSTGCDSGGTVATVANPRNGDGNAGTGAPQADAGGSVSSQVAAGGLAGNMAGTSTSSSPEGGSTSTSAGGFGASTSAGASTEASTEPIAIEDLCPVFASDVCLYLLECGGSDYRDREHCLSEVDCFGLPQLLASSASSAVTYDPSAVGTCHARFVESPCTFGFFLFTPDIYDVLAFCPGTLAPNLVAGDACVADGECQPGLYCEKEGGAVCPGTCRAFATEGQSCADFRCGDGLTCNSDICEPFSTEVGAPCDSTSVVITIGGGDECPVGEVCPTNTWCDQSAGVYRQGLLEGEPCGRFETEASAYYANCAQGLFCDAIDVFSVGTCQRPQAAGAPCVDSTYACQPGLHCVGSGGLSSSAVYGTCELPSSDGGECGGDDADCAAGLVCISKICKPPAGSGDTCSAHDDCGQGLLCTSGACGAPHYPGGACSDAGSCTLGRCVEGICMPRTRVGQPCADNSECFTNACVDGLCYDDSVCQAPAE